ncbi:MAG: sapC family protein, partial [Alphaproteobacteria bacterium]
MADEAQPKQLPMFYNNPVLLDGQKHKGLSLVKDFGLTFTKGSNAVPVNLVELPQIAHFYPIAFSNDGMATPVAILGVRNDENLFVNDKGEWAKDTYIPSYIRRYPFILTEINEGESLSLCIDEVDGVVAEN